MFISVVGFTLLFGIIFYITKEACGDMPFCLASSYHYIE